MYLVVGVKRAERLICEILRFDAIGSGELQALYERYPRYEVLGVIHALEALGVLHRVARGVWVVSRAAVEGLLRCGFLPSCAWGVVEPESA